MKSSIRISLISLMIAGLFGCQTGLDMLITNDLGENILVAVGSDTKTIVAGKSARLHYPDPDGRERGTLLITVGNCEMTFKLPMNDEDYPWSNKVKGTVPLQFETDMKLYAVPPDSTSSLPLTELKGVQGGSFPLQPTSKTCH